MLEIQIDTTQTSEKYICYKDKILPWFIGMMQEYEEQISPLMKKLNELFECNQHGQYSEDIRRLKEKAKVLKSEILSKHINENIFVSPYDSSPTRFRYFTVKPHFIPDDFCKLFQSKSPVIKCGNDNDSKLFQS